ncbi:MAG: hypothetical protein P1S60_10785 [Anaerolineae bacterium]|nr:hypothetical protein [Anaerolineae bacterium]
MMSSQKQRSIASGLLLILIGLAFVSAQVFPGIREYISLEFTWPMILIVIALGLLVLGALTGTVDMVVPTCILGGIGTILYFQNAGIITWQSWAFLWTLIPGFAGLGVTLAGFLKWKKSEIFDGLKTMLVSAVMFLVFGSLLGDMLGFVPFKQFLPILLIVLGLFMFIRALFDSRKD